MKTLEQQLSDYGEMIRADERRLHSWDLNRDHRLTPARHLRRPGGVWVAIATAVGVLLFVGSLVFLTSDDDPATTTLQTFPSTTTPVTTPTTMPDQPSGAVVPAADPLLSGILAMQLSTPVSIQSIQAGTGDWRAYEVPPDLLVGAYEMVAGGATVWFYEFRSEIAASVFLGSDPECEEGLEIPCVFEAPEAFQAGEEQFAIQLNCRCSPALVARSGAHVVFVQYVASMTEEGVLFWDVENVATADLLAESLLTGVSSEVPERISVVNGAEPDMSIYQVDVWVRVDTNPAGEPSMIQDWAQTLDSREEGRCQITIHDRQSDSDDCWQFPIEVERFDPFQVLEEYPAWPTLERVDLQSDGTWEATATLWEYDLDWDAAYALGLIAEDQSVVIDTFRVVVDGSKQSIRSILLIANGPADAFALPPQVDIAPSGSQQVSFILQLGVEGTAEICWPPGLPPDHQPEAECLTPAEPITPCEYSSDCPHPMRGEPADPK